MQMIAFPTRSRSAKENTDSRFTNSQRCWRRGAAVVELALLSPIWLCLLLGICEIGQAINAETVLSSAVRAASITASVPGSANVDVINDANAVWTSRGFSKSSLSVKILVNGVQADVVQATPNSVISITLSAQTSEVVVVDVLTYLMNKPLLSQSLTFIKQG